MQTKMDILLATIIFRNLVLQKRVWFSHSNLMPSIALQLVCTISCCLISV